MTRYSRILTTYAAQPAGRTTLQRRLLRHRLQLAGLTRRMLLSSARGTYTKFAIPPAQAEYHFHIHRDFNIHDSSTKNSYTHSNNTATTTMTGSYNSKPALVIQLDGPNSVGNNEHECILEHSLQSAEIQPGMHVFLSLDVLCNVHMSTFLHNSATNHAGPTADNVQQRTSGSELTLQRTG